MDNWYKLDTFCRKEYTPEKRVMVNGLVRKGMQGIPYLVKQEEVKKGKKKYK